MIDGLYKKAGHLTVLSLVYHNVYFLTQTIRA